MKVLTKKRIVAAALILAAVIFLSQCVIVAVFYQLALTPQKDAVPDENGVEWLAKKNAEDWYITSKDGLRLHAYFVKNADYSTSYALLFHQYSADATYMAEYAAHYSELGFNVLLVDARGHGKSEGDYVGMGWDDRLDALAWIEKTVEENENARIILHGVSLGGTTVSMVAGEKLPDNVRCIISDSGYATWRSELKSFIKETFGLPGFPLVDMASLYTKLRAGWSFDEADALTQVLKSKTPMFFIHGEIDGIVPVKESNLLFDACPADSDQYIAKGAGHGEALSANREKYWQKTDAFMLDYLDIT